MICRRSRKQDDRRARIIQKIARRCRIVPETGCHEWTGPTSGKTGRGKGYGRMSLDGRTVAVHIVVFVHYFGYLPANKQVDHVCNNRLCCNPDHLEAVSHRENQRRRAKAAKLANAQRRARLLKAA